ncbi:Conserved_hypothetical protein [Hexamita inflata]|uniref:Uncharacterized protein n=1 Tax=Hexamita inflata TaxID=28002 RepID=A0AA86NI35_9EUKA|nr:Conserved hypothetical protein [Hexamita inflata]
MQEPKVIPVQPTKSRRIIPVAVLLTYNDVRAQCKYDMWTKPTIPILNKSIAQLKQLTDKQIIENFNPYKSMHGPVILNNFQLQFFTEEGDRFERTISDDLKISLSYEEIYTQYFYEMCERVLKPVHTENSLVLVNICLPYTQSTHCSDIIMRALQNGIHKSLQSVTLKIQPQTIPDIAMKLGADAVAVAWPRSFALISKNTERQEDFGTNIVPLTIVKIINKFFGDELFQFLCGNLLEQLLHQHTRYSGHIRVNLNKQKLQQVQSSKEWSHQLDLALLEGGELFKLLDNQLIINELCVFIAMDEFCKWFKQRLISGVSNGSKTIVFCEQLTLEMDAYVVNQYMKAVGVKHLNIIEFSQNKLFNYLQYIKEEEKIEEVILNQILEQSKKLNQSTTNVKAPVQTQSQMEQSQARYHEDVNRQLDQKLGDLQKTQVEHKKFVADYLAGIQEREKLFGFNIYPDTKLKRQLTKNPGDIFNPITSMHELEEYGIAGADKSTGSLVMSQAEKSLIQTKAKAQDDRIGGEPSIKELVLQKRTEQLERKVNLQKSTRQIIDEQIADLVTHQSNFKLSGTNW